MHLLTWMTSSLIASAQMKTSNVTSLFERQNDCGIIFFSRNAINRPFPAHSLLEQLQRYLGMFNFYRQLLLENAKLVLLLTAILVGKHKPKNQCITLTSEASQAFAKSKNNISQYRSTCTYKTRRTSPARL